MRLAVVGRGLMGSAAARHLAKAGHDTVLIGPSEPADKAAHRGVFGSHYDEGRITRRGATHAFWSDVAAASIDRYAEIEAESGIAFYSPVGALIAGDADSAFFRSAKAVRDARLPDIAHLDRAGLAARFPYFAFGPGFEGFHEPDRAGHVSPRRLVAAQTEAARRHGAGIVDAAVTHIGETAAGIRLATTAGEIRADRVLVATGGMTDHVLPRPLGLKVLARTVVFFGIDEAEARRLTGMPSLVFRWDDRSEPYLLPPIRYPDGRILVKLGGDPVDVPLTSPAEIGDWFRSGGNPDVRDYLVDMMRALIPSLAVRAISMEPCMTTYTASGLPIADRLTNRIAVVTAGNGAAAKSSDEIGRLGAQALLGYPPPELTITKRLEGAAP